ncbi:hypothetical protein [Neobacillus muris]|nr:hypothetical protein [Neobacillus muris]
MKTVLDWLYYIQTYDFSQLMADFLFRAGFHYKLLGIYFGLYFHT